MAASELSVSQQLIQGAGTEHPNRSSMAPQMSCRIDGLAESSLAASRSSASAKHRSRVLDLGFGVRSKETHCEKPALFRQVRHGDARTATYALSAKPNPQHDR